MPVEEQQQKPFRRKSDISTISEIETLIAEEKDPRIRVQLLLMHRQNETIDELGSIVGKMGKSLTDLESSFESHAGGEKEIYNQIKGAWRLAGWVFGIAQLIVFGVYTSITMTVDNLNKAYQQDVVQHIQFQSQQKMLEAEIATVKEMLKDIRARVNK